MVTGGTAGAVLLWVWRGERTRDLRPPAPGLSQASAQSARTEGDAQPALPEALLKDDDRWQMPSAEMIAQASLAAEEQRQEVLKRLRALLADDWQPSDADLSKLRTFRVGDDAAEALKADFAYVRYTRAEAAFSVKSYLGVMFVLVQPPPRMIDPDVAQLVVRAQTLEGSHDLSLEAGDLGALVSLWRRYLAASPPSLDRMQPGHRGLFRSHGWGVGLEAWSVALSDLDGLCGVDMWTDAQLVGLRLLLPESAYDSALRKVWGRSTARPVLEPLNPEVAALEATDRWLDAKGKPTATSAHAAFALVRIALRERWQLSSSYTRGEEFVDQSRAYWVPAPGSHVSEDTWRVCEFDALAMRALQSARASVWDADLAPKLRGRQTRTQASIGMHALHADYDAACRWYANVTVPDEARIGDRRVREALQRGAMAWRKAAEGWDRLLATNPNGSPEEYALQLTALEDRLVAEHCSSADVRRVLKSAMEEVMKYSATHGVSRAIETE